MPRNPAAATAFGPIVLSAIEHNERANRRLVDDDLATAFLPLPLRLLVTATRWSRVRGAVIAASERSGPGLWANLTCRKRYGGRRGLPRGLWLAADRTAGTE